MDIKLILERINAAYALLGKEPITEAQYLAMCEANEEYQAFKETGDIFLEKDALQQYEVPVRNAFARTYRSYLRPEKTEEDKQFNRAFIDRILTKEGQVELFEETIRRAAELGPAFFYPASEEETRKFYQENMGFCETLMNINYCYETIKQMDVQLAPEIQRYYEDMKLSFEAFGHYNSIIKMKSSPYYPAFPETASHDMNVSMPIEMVAYTSVPVNSQAGPEYQAMRSFLDHAMGAADVYGSGQTETVQQMTAEGKLPKDIQNYQGYCEGKPARVDEVILGIKNKKPRTEFRRLPDEQIARTEEQMQHALVSPKEYRRLYYQANLGRALYFDRDYTTVQSAEAILDKTFGPKFVYDETLLETRTYTKEVFVQEDYSLPENCPFTPHQAALIGAGIFSTEEVSGQERPDEFDSARMRVDANYGFFVENMVSGRPRQTLGNVLTKGFVKARAKTPEVIRAYMNGDKEELARSLASAVSSSVRTIKIATAVGTSTLTNAVVASDCLELLSSDPDLMKIAEDKGYLIPDAKEVLASAKEISQMFQDFVEKGKAYVNTLRSGEQPTPEETAEIVTLNHTLQYLADYTNKMNDAVKESAVYKYQFAKAEEASNLQNKIRIAANKKAEKAKAAFTRESDPAKKAILQAQYSQLKKEADREMAKEQKSISRILEQGTILSEDLPADEFFCSLGKPGALEDLKEYMRSRSDVQADAKKDPKELINLLQLNINRVNFDQGSRKGMCKDDTREMENYILEKYGRTAQNVVTAEKCQKTALHHEAFAGALAAAQRGVRNGSAEFQTVEDMAFQLYRVETMLGEKEYTLNLSNIKKMCTVYNQTVRACNTYLKRKADRKELNADPASKSGKRIRAVKEFLSFCKETKCYYEDAKAQLERAAEAHADDAKQMKFSDWVKKADPADLGTLMTNLNDLAGHTHNPKQLHQIAQKMQSISKTIAKRNLTPDECGLTAEDLKKAAKTIQKDQPKAEKKAPEKEAAAPVLQ